jgi:PAS domain S-box-containing protein
MDVQTQRTGSLEMVRTIGLALGALLAGGLIAIFVIDRHIHIADVGNDSLAPWWMFVGWGVVFYALYWVGFRYLMATLRRNASASQQLIQELTATNESLQLAHRLGRTGTWTAVRDGPITWTGSASQLAGLDPSQSEITTQGFAELIHPADRERAVGAFVSALKSRGKVAVDFRFQSPDGVLRWLSVRGAVSEDQSRIAGTIVDVTRHMQAHERLVTAENQFRVLFEQNPLPFWVYDSESLRFLEVNAAAMRQYGYSHEEFLAMTILDIRPAEDRERVLRIARHLDPPGFDAPQLFRHFRKDGSLIDVRIHSQALRFQGHQGFLILAEDVTEQLAQQRELAHRATHDPVTGLLNGRALADRLNAESDHPWHLAYIQLRGLEAIEDSLGHEVATHVVQRLAARLQRLADRFGLAGHLRPEECVLAVRDPAQWDDALHALRDELVRPVTCDGNLQQLEYWIGTSVMPGDNADAMEAIRLAGLAAHVGRAEGRSPVAFEQSMTLQANQRILMAGRLRLALDNGEFQLHFQKIRDIAKSRTIGLEALLRWPQPEGGFIPPCDFIALAEDTGLIVPLGRWVLHEAARVQQQLQASGHGDLSIAINVSQAQFLRSDLVHDFDEVFRQFDLPRGALHVEMTETILMSRPEQSRAVLCQLQERGVCISLDDFGTGYSSMAYLRHLPIDSMKIDRSFVHNVHEDPRNASICQALLALAHGLDLTVVAEGVEKQAEYDWLKAHDCDQAQGYCIGRPAPLAQVLADLPEGAHQGATRRPTTRLQPRP